MLSKPDSLPFGDARTKATAMEAAEAQCRVVHGESEKVNKMFGINIIIFSQLLLIALWAETWSKAVF